jgi:hypothetical protein
MLFTWRQIEWAGRVILGAEFVLFIYWCVVIGVVGFSDPNTFLASLASAFHYTATFSVYAGVIEIDKAHKKVERGRRTSVEVSMSNMWIAIAVVGIVTDIAGLMLVVRGEDSAFLATAYYAILVTLNSLFVGMTAVDIAWLLVLRASIAVQNEEQLTQSAMRMVRQLQPPPLPTEDLSLTFRL